MEVVVMREIVMTAWDFVIFLTPMASVIMAIAFADHLVTFLKRIFTHKKKSRITF